LLSLNIPKLPFVTTSNISNDGKHMVDNCVEIWLENGIVNVLYLDHAEVTVEIKKQMHEIYMQITGGKKYPFLFASAGSIWFTKEAREYASEIDPQQPFLAVAMFAPTLGYRLIAEFYGKFSKPSTPYRVFKEMDEAVAWLKTF
jgi:hypothetical protein